jgi:benzaldehyde dehydrogenase (NAD)
LLALRDGLRAGSGVVWDGRLPRVSGEEGAQDGEGDSEYGLDLSIMTADISTGLQMGLRIPTGTAHINDHTVQDDANAPFGGMRHSGNSARFGGAAANIEAYTDTRWITARSTVPG